MIVKTDGSFAALAPGVQQLLAQVRHPHQGQARPAGGLEPAGLALRGHRGLGPRPEHGGQLPEPTVP